MQWNQKQNRVFLSMWTKEATKDVALGETAKNKLSFYSTVDKHNTTFISLSR